MDNPLSYDSKVESYDQNTGDLYMRTFGIADDLLTSNNWLAKQVAAFGKTFVGRWIVDHDKTKGIHAKFTNLKKWLDASKNAAIATITGVDVNEKTGALDVIYKVTDEQSKNDILTAIKNKQPIKWKFSSPAIWGHKLRRDPNTGTIIYDEWEGVHVAVFSNKVNPAFPAGIAQINENVCVGGIQCANELAAVAVKLNEDPLFIPNKPDPNLVLSNLAEKITFDKNRTRIMADNIKMSGEEGKQPKTVPYEEYVKVNQKAEQFESKYNESLKANETQSGKLKTIQEEKDALQNKWDTRENEDRKKYFTEKFSKILKDEKEVTEKVDHFLSKKYTQEDFEKLYGNMVKDAEELEAKNAKQPAQTPASKAGIAANNSQMDTTLKRNVDLAMGLINNRKRVF